MLDATLLNQEALFGAETVSKVLSIRLPMPQNSSRKSLRTSRLPKVPAVSLNIFTFLAGMNTGKGQSSQKKTGFTSNSINEGKIQG